jgi:2-(1,2-epoxy-1,2-dihydrophenyl)acetyl-CoA isomerase
MSVSAAPAAVSVRRRGPVTEVVLNRPERRNALSGKAIAQLTGICRELADAEVGAVLLRGEQEFFCAGLDITEFDAAHPPLEDWISAHHALADLDVPVVACLQGGAINAGAALALAADLIVAAESAYLQIMEASIGMVPTVNAAWLATRYPASVGLQLALPGTRMFASDLHRLGVVAQVAPDATALQRARDLAARLAAFPGRAAARTKRVLRAAREHGTDFPSAVAAASTAGAAR